MPIPGIPQPEQIVIDSMLRLRKYEENGNLLALNWYQDPETVYLVDGLREPYSLEKLRRMYRYLEARGELYWIELDEGGGFAPIGDVCFWQEDLPLVIGERRCRGRGIGRRVLAALIRRARALGYGELWVREIYEYNTASRRCFESQGFQAAEKTPQGTRYRLQLDGGPHGGVKTEE